MTFGPALVLDGEMVDQKQNKEAYHRFAIEYKNPRSAIGQTGPLSYVMVVVEGRGENGGATGQELAQIMFDLGCVQAYNLDGGNSSIMVWNNEVINDPSGGGRESSDALLIAEVNRDE